MQLRQTPSVARGLEAETFAFVSSAAGSLSVPKEPLVVEEHA